MFSKLFFGTLLAAFTGRALADTFSGRQCADMVASGDVDTENCKDVQIGGDINAMIITITQEVVDVWVNGNSNNANFVQYLQADDKLLWTYDAKHQTEQDIVIPKEVTVLGGLMSNKKYYGTFGEEVYQFCSRGGAVGASCHVKFETGSKFRVIGPYAFLHMEHFAIDFPASLETIEEFAFKNTYAALTSVTFPEDSQLTRIGRYAFEGSHVESMDLSNTQIQTTDSRAFYGASSLKTIDFPVSLHTIGVIGSYPFQSSAVPSLESITFPADSKLTRVEEYAFYGSSSLETLTFPASLQTIGRYAFQNSAVETVDLSSTQIETTDSLNQAFVGGYSLRTVHLPASLQTIGNSFFYSSPVTSFTFPANSQLTGIGESAFYGSDVKTLDLSNTQLDTVGKEAFRGSSLETIDFPASLQTIGQNAFQNSALMSVTFPAGSQLTDIGEFAFYGVSLDSVDLSNTQLETVGKNAFYYAGELKTVKFPASLQTIANYAFGTLTSNNPFSGPEELDFSGTQLKTVGDSAFYGFTGIKTIRFPETLTSLGRQAFYSAVGGEYFHPDDVWFGGDLGDDVTAGGLWGSDVFGFYYDVINFHYPTSVKPNWGYDECSYYRLCNDWCNDGTGEALCGEGCEHGKAKSEAGECEECTPGKYSYIDSYTQMQTCRSCTPAKYADSSGTFGACKACEAGKFSNTEGSSECETCTAGFASAGGALECVDLQAILNSGGYVAPNGIVCSDVELLTRLGERQCSH